MTGREQQNSRHEAWVKKHLEGVPDIFSLFIMDVKNNSIRSKETSPGTMKTYLERILAFYDYITSKGIDIYEVRYSDITAYKEFLNDKSAAYFNLSLSVINRFYDFLVRDKRIDSNPCANQRKKMIAKKEEIVYMSDKELKYVLRSMKRGENRKTTKYLNRDLCLIHLGCSTGLRISEILNIDVEDVDFDTNEIHNIYAKGYMHEAKSMQFSDTTRQLLIDWINDREMIFGNRTGALFVNPSGNRMGASGVRKMLHKATKDLGKNITPHKMRTTCGMKTYAVTHDIYAVAEQLGHARIETSMIYAGSTKERRKEIVDRISVDF